MNWQMLLIAFLVALLVDLIENTTVSCADFYERLIALLTAISIALLHEIEIKETRTLDIDYILLVATYRFMTYWPLLAVNFRIN